MNYQEFIIRKSHTANQYGFKPSFIPDFLIDFQKHLTEWSVMKGRDALFEDCGLGKTIQSLVWGENVVRHTNKDVLILTPLAVSHQFVLEANKFGMDCHRSHHGETKKGINIINYERLHFMDPNQFAGVVCDESSILKNFDGARRLEITEFMKKVPYRLLATATAAPNDFVELGTSSEALGELGHMDMLNRFFKNDQHNSSTRRFHGETVKWRFKGHGEQPFWRWVCSWARAIRKPSDIGFDDSRFILPELTEKIHIIESITPPNGMLFNLPAVDLPAQREERRRTIAERCQAVAEIVNHNDPALIWCHLNPEGELLHKLIPNSVEVSGRDSDESKEEKLIAFARGEIKKLITKPKIGAWGLNFQHCGHVVTFPSHSYEQYYQGVRRCWRFGRTGPVRVDIVTTEGERAVFENLKRKSDQADRMFANLVAAMNNELSIKQIDHHTKQMGVPSWL